MGKNRTTPWVNLLGLLIVSFTIYGCLGGETDTFDQPGESITLNFDGPVSYSYKAGGQIKTYSTEGEDKIILQNTELEKTTKCSVVYVRFTDGGLKLHLGLDPFLKEEGKTTSIFTDNDMITTYINNAVVNNKEKGDGPIDMAEPISFKGNFTGITTNHKDFICKEETASGPVELHADQKVPYKLCEYKKEYTGGMVATTYSKEDILAKIAHQSQLFNTFPPSDELVLVVKASPATPAKTQTAEQTVTNNSTANSGGGCSLTLNTNGSLGSIWAGCGILFLVPAAMGWLRLRQRT